MHLAVMLERAQEAYPEAEVLVDGQERLRYGEWSRRVDAVGRGFYEMGVRPGDRVAVCARNGEPWATAYFALLKLGAAPVLLNFRWKAEELAYAMDEATVRAVVYDGTAGPEVGRALAMLGSRARGVRQVTVAREAEGDGEAVAYQELLSAPPGPPLGPRDDSCWSSILYTSGTTGRPKGVCRSHRSDWAAALALVVEHRWERFERTLGAMPFCHTMGLHTLLSIVLLNGTVVVMPSLDAREALRLIAAEGVTALYLVPTAFHDLVGQADAGGWDVPPVPKLATAGAPMPESLVKACARVFRPRVFVNHYGCTEMHVIAVNPDLTRKPRAAGRPALGARVRVAPLDRGRGIRLGEAAAPGVLGAIMADAASAQAFSGYLNRPDATAEVLGEGWYVTGDLGFVDADGDLHVVGRLDDMIISGGENIHPAEVEEVLRRHPAVRDVAVVGMPDERWGEVVTAFVVPKAALCAPADRERLAGDLERFCRAAPDLARYKRPRRFVFVAAIPRTPSGKVMRRALRDGAGRPCGAEETNTREERCGGR